MKNGRSSGFFRRNKRLNRSIALGVAVVAIASVAVLLGQNARSLPFDRAAWIGIEPTDRMQRYRMVKDLLRRYDFSGWSRSQVENLLGAAEWETDSQFAIAAGQEYGWDIDPIRTYRLAFAVDARGKVQRVSWVCSGPRC